MQDYGKDSEHKRLRNQQRMKKRRAGYYLEVEKPKRLEARLKNIEACLWRTAKERAKKQGLPFNLEVSDIIIPTFCPLLEIPLKASAEKATNNSPTLDKIIPSLGYIKGNVKVISRLANWLKSNATESELRTFYKNIFNYLKVD